MTADRRPYTRLRAWISLTAFAIGITAVEVARPTASYKAIELGATAFEIGVVGGSFGLLALLVAIPIGRRVDIDGERMLILLGLGGLVLAVLVELVAASLAVLILGQALLGLGQIALAIATQSIAANSQDSFTVDERFAQLAIAASIGLLAGPAISGFAIGTTSIDAGRAEGIRNAYLIAISLAAIGFAVAWFTVRSSRRSSAAGGNTGSDIRTILRRPGIVPALVASASVLTTVDLLIAYLPLLGEERHLPPTVIGMLLSVRAAAELAARFSLPLFLRRLTRSRILSMTFLMAAAALISLSVFAGSWALVAAMVVVGFSLGLCAPLTAAWIVSSAPVRDRGTTLAMRMASNRVGQLTVPAALGAIAVALGSFVVFGVAAVGLISSAVWVARYQPRH